MLFIPIVSCESIKYSRPYTRLDGIEGIASALGLSMHMFRALSDVTVERFQPSGVEHVNWYVMGPIGESGAIGNYWTSAEQFPIPTLLNLYLTSDHELSTTQPDHDKKYTYNYDPLNPVPTIGGSNLFLFCGQYTQNEIEDRADMVIFTLPPQTEPLALNGASHVVLYVSSDAKDTDFTAKVWLLLCPDHCTTRRHSHSTKSRTDHRCVSKWDIVANPRRNGAHEMVAERRDPDPHAARHCLPD